MKKMIVLLLVVLLLASMIQVVLANPPGPVPNSCHMGASYWEPGTGPGNANGVAAGERGMYNVHFGTNPHHGAQGPDDYYTNGAANMDIICPG